MRLQLNRRRHGAIVAAAMSLPGVWTAQARADTAPDKGVVAFRYLHYEDSQPGLDRIKVDSPSIYVLAPIGSQWSIEGSGVVDSISGATPRWQSAISSASSMSETRKAADVKVTRYFDRSSLAVGASTSTEHDYVSNALSLGGTLSTEDNNTSFDWGVAGTHDRIDPTDGAVAAVSGARRNTIEWTIGATRALSANDVAQWNIGYSSGHGYYDDPYKLLDTRPDHRRQGTLLARWNHFVGADGSTLRASYRFYRDNFGVTAHTLEGEWAKPVSESLTLTPSLRLYTQSAADFYTPAVVDANGQPVLPDVQPGQLNSGDQRLSAFGAVALGLKIEYRIDSLWTVDAKVEAYEQRSSWRVGGSGATGVDPFHARILQLGASRSF